MRYLRSIFRESVRESAPFPVVAYPVCVIGDLHGMADLLEQMLECINAQPGADSAKIVIVGDMIDRGPESAATLLRARQLNQISPDRVICLMGNHERMMLDFLADPPRYGGRWMDHGGLETLASFGVQRRIEGNTPEDRFCNIADALRNALPAGMEEWLAALPLLWRHGDLVVTHAGADPALPVDQQTVTALLWGHSDFSRRPRRDGIWLAHGHVVQTAPGLEPGRIAVDTGAWSSGRLSAAWIDADGVRFLSCGEVSR